MVAVAFGCIGYHDGIDCEKSLLPFEADEIFMQERDRIVLGIVAGKLLKKLAIFKPPLLKFTFTL